MENSTKLNIFMYFLYIKYYEMIEVAKQILTPCLEVLIINETEPLLC